MLLKEYPFSLPTISNLVKKLQGQIVQNDADSNKLRIQLTNEQNKAFDITGYTAITISVLKPDGTSSIDSVGTHLSVLDATKGIIEVTLRLSAIDVVGMCQATLEVYEGAKRLTSARFSFDVIPDIGGNSDPSGESNLPILQSLIVDVNEALVRAENVQDGAPGEKGETGEGLKIIDKIDSASLLPALGSVGDAYLVGANNELYTWTVSGEWHSCGPIKGEQGIQGIQGIQGEQGIQGSQGEQGIQGVPGQDGTGTTVTTSATNGNIKINGAEAQVYRMQDDEATDVKIGDRTINQATSTAFANTGKITQIFSWFAKMIKAITGKTNWYDAPIKSIEGLNDEISNSLPKSGGTITGNLEVNGALTKSGKTIATIDKIDIMLPYNTGFENASIASSLISKSNNLVQAVINAQRVGGSDFVANTSYLIGTLPVGYRPAISVVGSGSTHTPNGTCYCAVTSSGEVYATPYVNCKYIRFQMTFFI